MNLSNLNYPFEYWLPVCTVFLYMIALMVGETRRNSELPANEEPTYYTQAPCLRQFLCCIRDTPIIYSTNIPTIVSEPVALEIYRVWFNSPTGTQQERRLVDSAKPFAGIKRISRKLALAL